MIFQEFKIRFIASGYKAKHTRYECILCDHSMNPSDCLRWRIGLLNEKALEYGMVPEWILDEEGEMVLVC